MPRAVRADAETGLGDRVAVARQIQHEERDDERAEAIDERAAEQDPRGGREGAEVFAQRGQSNSTRTRMRRCARIATRNVPILFQMVSLISAMWSGRKYCVASMTHENVCPRKSVSK